MSSGGEMKQKSLAMLGGLVGVPALLALMHTWKGYVLSVLWGWFIVPVFGLPALSIPFAIGVCIVVGLLTFQHHEEKRSFGQLIPLSFLLPATALLCGWIVTKFL